MRLLEKIQKLKIVDGLLVLGFLLVILGIGMNFSDQLMVNGKTEVVKSSNVGLTNPSVVGQIVSEVVVDIAGEVINPGVYKLKNESRIGDVLVMAGGLGVNADRDWVEKNLNKAEKVYDGEKIYIPKVGEVLGVSRDVLQNVSTKNNKKVGLNSATLEQLDALDGIGPAIAQRIIDYRTANGGFKSVEEIKLVPGIGDKMFEKIKNEIQL